jgi:hypothetical protein
MKQPRNSLLVVAIAIAILAATAAQPASADDHDGAQNGVSTPGATILAQNPGANGELRLTLTAHTDHDGVPSAALVLRVAGVRVLDYDAHRVVITDTACDGGHEAGAESASEPDGVRGLVRGTGVLATSAFGLRAGSTVQVWLDVKDRGAELYGDDARVRIRPAPHGEDESTSSAEPDSAESCSDGGEGWSFDSAWIPIQQVRTHVVSASAP